MMTVVFLVNGRFHSAMGYRARGLASYLSKNYDVRIAYRTHRKLVSLVQFIKLLAQVRPDATYVFDMSYSGVLAAACYKLIARKFLVIDTGDAISELVKSFGGFGIIARCLVRSLETISYIMADRIVVRGTFHQRWLSERGISSEVIPDGVETDIFHPSSAADLGKELGLNGYFTVGALGTSVWSEKCQMCFGWELVELIRLLKHKPIKAMIIGDGSGIPRLKQLCREYDIEDRVVFPGYIPYTELPRYLKLMDVCLSSQPNVLPYQVRTTGKLPLYLAAGRFVLASRVGEASLILGDDMLLEYDGLKDPDYPRRLAERVVDLMAHPGSLSVAKRSIELAKRHFDYSVLATKVASLFEDAARLRAGEPAAVSIGFRHGCFFCSMALSQVQLLMCEFV
jgi:glycosyltransferase involved in cell wall biosynthesis